MALRMIYDKAMTFAARQYQGVLGNQLAQYGELFVAVGGNGCMHIMNMWGEIKN